VIEVKREKAEGLPGDETPSMKISQSVAAGSAKGSSCNGGQMKPDYPGRESLPGLRDERCECGNLLCKISKDTVEIKCRRCKRIHIIPIERLRAEQPES